MGKVHSILLLPVLSVVLSLILSSVFLAGCGNDKSSSVPVITNSARICNVQDSKNAALWEYMNDWYWDDALDQTTNPSDFDSLQALINDIKEKNPIDRFSFIITKQAYNDIFVNSVTFDFGLSARIDEANKELVVGFVYDNSNAKAIGMRRGDRIVKIEGESIDDAITDGSFQSGEFWANHNDKEQVEFTWRTVDNEIKTMSKSTVNTHSVLATQIIGSELGKVGYLVYDSFTASSERELNDAFKYFEEQAIDELIVDLRYNHGGSSHTSNQLATQIGGDNVLGRIYNTERYNANHSNYNRDVLFNLFDGTNPLSLARVVFLTTEESASGSEVIINSLKPHIDVKVVGQRTYGKPVGMRVVELCEQMIFAITTQNYNAEGFGDFFDGIPVDCAAEDTIPGDWGVNNDPLLNEAMYLLNNGECSVAGMSNRSQNTLFDPHNKKEFSELLLRNY
ncbi:MAG: hypothetical protein HRT38_17025 [Alteromonadaceae bacterium]|nr:hypothetical protein [Alteromonadaceae bacterium]